jgi:D-beta-D-heptose 7-phosphate kinase/D-beta-D-heptose 1-phosphate adenosyltransferase
MGAMRNTEKLSGIRVLCVGDVMLDRFVSGQVKRISPESPVPVLSISGSQIFPGGAANVARNIASLGGTCTLVGVIGSDAAGRELQEAVTAIPGLRCEFHSSATRPTSEKTRFVAHGQHMLRTDAEVVGELDAAAQSEVILLIERLAASHDVMVLSDYSKGLLTDRVIGAALRKADALGMPVAVDPKSVNLARYAGATVLTPNSKEAFEATGIDPSDDDERAALAGESILEKSGVKSVLLTRGPRGMTLVSPDSQPLHIRASAREVYDVVGAGDTAIATLALALGAKLDMREAAHLANLAAGVVVGKRGTATLTQTELADELARIEGGSLRSLEDKIMSLADAVKLANTWRKNGQRIGFTNGCFDILHVGHLAILHFAQQHSGKLIVAVNSDASVRRLKAAGRPINPQQDRSMVLAALSAVDAVVVFEEDTPLKLIEHINPDVLVKGGDYTVDTIVGASHVLAYGGKVLTCPLIPGKSTTNVLGVARGAG